MTVFAYLLAYSAFTALALGMSRHHRVVMRRQPLSDHLLRFRIVGWSAMCVSLVIACYAAKSWPHGAVGWLGAASAATLLLAVLLPVAPRFAGALALAAPAIGALSAAA